jgi:hypothetical protein
VNAPHHAFFGTPVRMFEPPEDHFPTITRYWNEPAFRAELDAETQDNRDTANAHLDAHRDAAIRKLGYL